MEVLKYLRMFLKSLGILQFDLIQRYQNIPILFIQRTVVLLGLLFNFVSSLLFLLLQPSKDHQDRAEAFAFTMTYVLMMIWYIYSVRHQRKIEYILNSLEEIIENRNYNKRNQASRAILNRLDF